MEPLEARVLFASGDLDPSFSGDGIVTTNITQSDAANSVVIQSNQRIVVGGSTGDSIGLTGDFAITRYNSDGSLDTTFGGGDGIVTTDFDDIESVEAVALAPGNKIVAVGYTGSGSARDWAVARYNADGSLDTTFGGDGTVTTDFFFGSDAAAGVTVQPDGRILVTGVSTGANTQLTIVRYLVDGQLDPTFDGDGKAFVDFFSGADAGSAVLFQPADNKVVVAGTSAPPGSYRRFVLVRFNGSNGALDPTFGDIGKATADFGGPAVAKDLVVNPDGSYVVGGVVDGPGGADTDDFAVARFTAAGAIDTTFGTGGRGVVPGFGGSQGGHYGLARQADGKLLLGGLLETAAGAQLFGVARFNANGTVDASFGTGGTVQTDASGGAGNSPGADLALQAGGRIVMAGTTGAGSPGPDFAVVRYINTVVQPSSISGTVFDDVNGNGVLDAGEPGLPGWTVYQDVNDNGVFDPSAATVASTDVPKNTLDFQTVSSNLTVAGLVGELVDVNITFSIKHTYDADLDVTLVSPAGTRIELFSDVGLPRPGSPSTEDFNNTTLDDQAVVSIADGRPPFVGSYRPELPMTPFIGQDPNGQWTLEIYDDEGGDSGQLLSWSLAITARGEASTVSGPDGSYSFTGIAPGTYRIRQVLQNGFAQTAPTENGGAYLLTVAEGQAVTGRDFGNTRATTAVVGRHVFYNNSVFDGNNAAINAAGDAAAIATDKQALRPGQTASFANVTTYHRGINGIMVDIRRLSGTPLLSYRVGNGGDPNTWAAAPAPQTTSIASTGVPGLPAETSRVTVVWPEGMIRNQWLQVTVARSAGLEQADVFYFGNLAGETDGLGLGASPAAGLRVNSRDLLLAMRNSPAAGAAGTAVTNVFDHNKDGRVNGLDLAVIHRNLGRSLGALTAPAAPPAAALFGDAPVTAAAAGLRLRDDELAALLA